MSESVHTVVPSALAPYSHERIHAENAVLIDSTKRGVPAYSCGPLECFCLSSLAQRLPVDFVFCLPSPSILLGSREELLRGGTCWSRRNCLNFVSARSCH